MTWEYLNKYRMSLNMSGIQRIMGYHHTQVRIIVIKNVTPVMMQRKELFTTVGIR